jgi:pyruvate dehydrogenase E1 component alpha subunit
MDRDELIAIYRMMLLIRRFEDRAGFAYTQGKIGGYLHLYIGQEAVALGFISALRPDDCVMTSYRDHAHYLALGADPKAGMAELFGRATGCSKGKGGSMHLFDREHNFFGGTGIVGSGIPIGAGVAQAIKYRGGDQVCLCFFGDGAINAGAYHESINLAALWKLPVIFVCENNLYAMGTSVQRSSSVTDLVKRSEGYDVKRERVDGQDFFAVRELAERAIADVREHQQPWFVEAVCYRYRGHGAADPGNYRTREEVAQWRERDPIGIVERRLLEQEWATEEDLKGLQQEVNAEVEVIMRFANESPYPPASALYEHIYAPPTPVERAAGAA